VIPGDAGGAALWQAVKASKASQAGRGFTFPCRDRQCAPTAVPRACASPQRTVDDQDDMSMLSPRTFKRFTSSEQGFRVSLPAGFEIVPVAPGERQVL
jgi:hypothetical protein